MLKRSRQQPKFLILKDIPFNVSFAVIVRLSQHKKCLSAKYCIHLSPFTMSRQENGYLYYFNITTNLAQKHEYLLNSVSFA